MERWLSGLKHAVANCANFNRFRGFESHPFCQNLFTRERMEQATVIGPRHLTKAEIKQQRAQKKAENLKKWDHAAVEKTRLAKKDQGRLLKKYRLHESKNEFPHAVYVNAGLFAGWQDRIELRKWFWTQDIRAHRTDSDNTNLDVIWDPAWCKFSFAKPEHLMMFQLVYG